MMASPKRLLEVEPADETGALQRKLLASLTPPRQARELVWRRLAAQASLTAGTSGAIVSAAGKAAASAGTSLAPPAAGTSSLATGSTMIAKLGLALLIAAPLTGGALYLSVSGTDAPSAAASSKLAPAGKRNAKAVQTTEAKPVPGPPDELAPRDGTEQEFSATAAKVKTSRKNALLEENRLLRQARAAARAGDAGGALATLEILDRRFRAGALMQERELLRIQTLNKAGSANEAAARAERFLKRYPESPYARHVLEFAQPGVR
jgi:hypothetical protein